MDVLAAVGSPSPSVPYTGYAAASVGPAPANQAVAAPPSDAIDDSPSPTPSAELAAGKSLPLSVQYAPSGAPHGAQPPAKFDSTA
jgi:hypothetical protein